MDPTKTIQEETRHNETPPTMTKKTSLEASHELITEGLVATIEKAKNTTEAEEDTPLFRKKVQRVLGWECDSLPRQRRKTETSAHSLTSLKRGIGRPSKPPMNPIDKPRDKSTGEKSTP